MKQVEITSKVVGRGESEGITSAIPSINLSGFALKSDLLTLEKKFSDFLNVPIIDGTINRWNELETFLAGISEDYNLLSLLNGKADKSYVDTNFVTIAGTEDVKGLHNFVNGLKIGGLPITKKHDDVVYLDANLVVRGGITMYAENEVNVPSILDSLPIANANTQDKASKGIASFDSAYFKVTDGWVTLTSAPSSGASYLGELLNVDSSIDATASVDRVLYQPAGSAMWTWRELPKDGVVGNYLPLSGGTLTASVAPQLKIVNNGNTDAYITMTGSNGYSAHAGMVKLPTTGDAASFGYSERIVFPVTGGMYYRNGYNGDNQVILHAGNIGSYNAGSATKLQTARTIWGQSFDGTGNISGTLYLNNNVSISGYVNNVAYDIFRINDNNHLLVGYGHAPNGNTSIYGNNVYLRNGANRGYALTAIANGNVGIGTTSPAYKLDVNGASRSQYMWFLNTSLNGNAGYIGRGSSSSNDIYLLSSGSLRFGTNNVDSKVTIDTSGNMLVTGGITMYSDIRKKTKLQDVELSLSQIANAPLIQHYYNSDQEKTTHVGSIAQYWAGLNDWFCKLDNEGFYTMEIQNCALASAISIARHLEKYESKTDKTIRKMKQRIQELEEEVERLKKGA